MSVLVVLTRALVVGFAVLDIHTFLGLTGEMAGIRPAVAMRRVLDQLRLGLLEALGLALACFAKGSLFFLAAVLERFGLFHLFHRFLPVGVSLILVANWPIEVTELILLR